jgi:4-hydroxybenzoate polyprenyltransferase
MISRSTLIHLRFPFSFFLAPIFLFGLTEASRPLDALRTSLIFVVLHLLLYPASNGFNSYFDRDEGSIGGIRCPPPVTGNLLAWSLLLDLVAIAAAALVSPWFALVAVVYGTFSKAYSWDKIRWKRRPVFSWLGIGIVQGGLVFLATACFAGSSPPSFHTPSLWTGAAAISAYYLAGYPLTQVYQHDEDARRGDRTISMMAGVRGTFILSGLLFTLALGLFLWHFMVLRKAPARGLGFLAVQVPLVLFFLHWARLVRKDPRHADFRHSMIMNLGSSGLMNTFLVAILVLSLL